MSLIQSKITHLTKNQDNLAKFQGKWRIISCWDQSDLDVEIIRQGLLSIIIMLHKEKTEVLEVERQFSAQK